MIIAKSTVLFMLTGLCKRRVRKVNFGCSIRSNCAFSEYGVTRCRIFILASCGQKQRLFRNLRLDISL